jgi:hypothetical protein
MEWRMQRRCVEARAGIKDELVGLSDAGRVDDEVGGVAVNTRR